MRRTQSLDGGMGACGRTVHTHLFSGGIAENVVHEALRPVLTVR
ncbi:MAG: hypothetical protein V3V94_03650 [Candidatus Brocadiales bacterium]